MIEASLPTQTFGVETWRDYFEITDEDLAHLRSLQPFLERRIDRILDRLCSFLARHPESRRLIPDDASLARVRRLQRDFFLGLLRGTFDGSYLHDRRRVGETAERIGLSPTLYVGAYAVFMRGLQDALHEEFSDPAEANRGFNAFRKLVFLDEALTLERFVEAREATIASQQAAIRELSTPVIRVHDRILLMPLVGSFDSERALRAQTLLLHRIAAERATAAIIDISGIPTMDTHALKALLETATAASLLGAKTIVSGLSASVASAIVRLGIDTDRVATVTVLSDAIDVALQARAK